jgi:hypothetical protein
MANDPKNAEAVSVYPKVHWSFFQPGKRAVSTKKRRVSAKKPALKE